jgi:uncharacterized protein (TIGR02118 family)
MTTMARLLVLWSTPEDPDFFEQHYREVHVPLVKKMPGMRRYTFSRDARPVRGDLYYRVGEVDFDDITALQRAFASPEGRAAASDVNTLSSAAGAQVRSMIYELEEL